MSHLLIPTTLWRDILESLEDRIDRARYLAPEKYDDDEHRSNSESSDRNAADQLALARKIPVTESPADDEVIPCALCQKLIWFRDSWSPGDEATCAECDTTVTGRTHPPSLVPWKDLPPPLTNPSP